MDFAALLTFLFDVDTRILLIAGVCSNNESWDYITTLCSTFFWAQQRHCRSIALALASTALALADEPFLMIPEHLS
jgi:hypothetical protein